MSLSYTLYRGGHKIAIEKEPEFFTAILPDSYQVEAVQKHKEVQAIKRVFQHVYKVQTYDDQRDQLMERMRFDQKTPSVCHHAYIPAGDSTTRYYLTEMIVVCFHQQITNDQIEAILQDYGLTLVRHFEMGKSFLLRVTASAGKNPVKVCDALHNRPEVIYAEPNLVNRFQPMYQPVDNLFELQWHLNSNGGIELVRDADVGATKAWNITRGSRDVIVAVLDDGFDVTHPDLQGTDKIIGPRDFADGDFFPLPMKKAKNYHGTPCAGVAIAEENGSGVVGMAPGCKFMPIRFDLNADDALLYDIFEYAGQRADVLSCSWGPVPVFAPLSSLLYQQLTDLAANGGPQGRGTVICFAAGNYNAPIQDLENTTFQWRHPRKGIRETTGPIANGHAAHPDVICVSASTSQNRKAAYSNWGKEIAVAAPSNNWHPLEPQKRLPGRGIWTTDNEVYGLGFESGSRYTGNFGGTSSATPLVAGIAALMRSVHPELPAAMLRKILLETADKIEDNQPDPALNFRKGTYDRDGHSEWFGYGKVNAYAALRKVEQYKHGAIPTSQEAEPAIPEGSVRIMAALANPDGLERGNEQVLLLNVSNQMVSLDGWKVKDKAGREDELMGIDLLPGHVLHYTLTNPKLPNTGSWIGLEGPGGRLIHGVTYSKADAAREGWLIVF
jgi:subtilisin family serine protease